MHKRRDPAMYAIRAPDRGTGWTVQIKRLGVTHRRNFSVWRYGDTARALAAAQAWRDEVALRTPAKTLQQAGRELRPNNSSGHPGVHRIVRRVKLKGGGVQLYVSWMARSPEAVQPPRSRSFAIGRYGEKDAYERAVAAREGFVLLLDGYLLPSVPLDLHPRGCGATR